MNVSWVEVGGWSGGAVERLESKKERKKSGGEWIINEG